MPTAGSIVSGGGHAGAPSLSHHDGVSPPLEFPTTDRTAKPRLCDDCPIPASGPKLLVAAPRIVVLSFTAYANPNRGSYPPYQLSMMLRRPIRPAPLPAKIVAPRSPPAPGFGVVGEKSL